MVSVSSVERFDHARSFVLTGIIRHSRSRKIDYEFTHRVWYLELDLDEIPLVTQKIYFFSDKRPNVLRFKSSDHFTPNAQSLATALRTRLEERGWDITGWRIALVTYPRVFGFVFNPVSFYLCRDSEGGLRHVIAEVNNTHGERELYDFDRDASMPDSEYRSKAEKRMYVSPFIGAARYELNVFDEPSQLRISISEWEGEERTLFAHMDLMRDALTNKRILKVLVREPFVTLKTIILIGWHAWRLRRHGLKWERHVSRKR